MQKTSKKGSALVFSLIVMFIILGAALGVTSISVIEQKNSSATGKSTQAFQVADSAVELVLKKAVSDPQGTNLNNLGGTCASGVVSGVSVSGGLATLTFSDINGALVDDCLTTLSEVTEVKSVATYSSTTRAIGAAVAAGTLSWNDLSLTGNWGNDNSYDKAQYAKDARTGIVYLRGAARLSSGFITCDSSWNFTPRLADSLSSEFTPLKPHYFPALCAGGGMGPIPCSVTVSSSGIIGAKAHTTFCGTGNTFVFLDGISFPTN